VEINWPKAAILIAIIVVLGGLVGMKVLHPEALLGIVGAVAPSLWPMKPKEVTRDA
jgi:hypothetical protein